jgi:hydroxylaminobenzene mutase
MLLNKLSSEHNLLVSGIFLFLLRLVQDAGVHQIASPRLALSAHIVAVQNGIVLNVFSLVSSKILLTERASKLASFALSSGMQLIWMSITIAAIVGAASAFPFAIQGIKGTSKVDLVVSTIVVIGSATSILGTCSFLIGAMKRKA